MKKIITVMVCLAILGVLQVKAQLAQITLMHDGSATQYNANQTAAALEAAQDGDVLYFTEGSYTGGVTITKRVGLVGVGQGTVINGDVTINLTEGVTPMPAQMLDALQITGSITMRSNTNGVKLRKVKFNSFKLYSTSSTVVTNCTIDRCFITGTMQLGQKMEGVAVLNTKINDLQGQAATASAANFINCNIYRINNSTGGDKLLATLINSVIYRAFSGNSNYLHADCMFINCLGSNDGNLVEVMKRGTMNNSWTMVIFGMDQNTLELTDYADDVLSKYKGTDGTPVGITGGVAPFTLVPSAPRITESTIKVDPEKKLLNVNLKVVAN